MKTRFCLMGFALLLAHADVRAEQKEIPQLNYKFTKDSVSKYEMTIRTEMQTHKEAGGTSNVGDVSQTTTQELLIEEAVKDVDMTGNAEVQITFKSAKMKIEIQGEARDQKPPDTMKFFAGRSVTAYITPDGKVLSVSGIASFIAGAKQAAKDPGLMQLIEQNYTEDYFKEVIQNLHPQFPMDPAQTGAGWETVSDVLVPRTAFKLRITTKSSVGRVDGDVARISQKGGIKVVPINDMAPVDPAAPTVSVPVSGIQGDMDFSVGKGQLIQCTLLNKLQLNTMMRFRPQSGRGSEFQTEVRTKKSTTTTIKLVK